jgi:spore coat protein SA
VRKLTVKKPKVVIITPGSFPIPSPRSSSVETVVDRVTHALQEKVDFYIAGKKSRGYSRIEQNGNIQYYRCRFKNWRHYLLNVIPYIKEINPDIIQVENRPKYALFLRKSLPHQKILLSLHSTAFISSSSISKNELILSVHAADKVIVNSNFLKKVVIQKTQCNSEKVVVNHLGVDVSQFTSKWDSDLMANREVLKIALNLENKQILLFVGRLKKMKGIHHLLNILPELIKMHPDLCLVIIGNAFYSSSRKTNYVLNLEKKANQFPDHVKLLPFIPHSEIHRWFQLASIVYVPSKGKEAFGLVNVEAMACGVPVIASRAGGMKEIIQHGKTGYLIDINNIEPELTHYTNKLLSNPGNQKEVGLNAISSINSHFTWDHCATRLYELYLNEWK